jgi:hypothetical protein
MNTKQYTSLNIHLSGVFSRAVIGYSDYIVGDKVFHGNHDYFKGNHQAKKEIKSEMEIDDPVSKNGNSSSSEERHHIPVFESPIKIYGHGNLVPQITCIESTRQVSKLTIKNLTWSGSLNCFDRTSKNNSNSTLLLDHFVKPEFVSHFFKNGMTISMKEILQLYPLKDLIDQDLIMQYDIFKKLDLVGQTQLFNTCSCKSDPNKPRMYNPGSIYNFNKIYAHGITIENIESTFPVECGLKTNCVNAENNKDRGELFYSSFLATKSPIDKSPEKEKLPFITKFSEAFNDIYWASTFGGLTLDIGESVKNINHLSIPLISGMLKLPNEVLSWDADTDKKKFFDTTADNPFFFIPNEHFIYDYFESLYLISKNENLPEQAKLNALWKKDISELFYQFIKLYSLTPIGEAIFKLNNNSLPDNLTSNLKKLEMNDIIKSFPSQQKESKIGNGLVMKLDDIKKVVGWIYSDYTNDVEKGEFRHWFKRLPKLDEICFSLFRSNTVNSEWIVGSDFNRFSKEQLNQTYTFKCDISVFFSVYPPNMDCLNNVVPSKPMKITSSENL